VTFSRLLLFSTVFFLLAASLTVSVAAQHTEKLPGFEVEFDRQMDFDLENNAITIEGPVRMIARQPRAATLSADAARLQLGEKAQKLIHAEALGNVKFATTTAASATFPPLDLKANAAKAEYDPAALTVLLSGSPKALISSLAGEGAAQRSSSVDKLVLTGTQMIYDLSKQTLTVTGHAHFEGLAKSAGAAGRQRIIADADRAVLEPGAKRILLQGSARLQFQPIPPEAEAPTGMISGDKIEFDLEKSRARVAGAPDKPGRLQFDIPRPSQGEKQ